MEANMSVDEVVSKIAELMEKEGQPLRKKQVKKTHTIKKSRAIFTSALL